MRAFVPAGLSLCPACSKTGSNAGSADGAALGAAAGAGGVLFRRQRRSLQVRVQVPPVGKEGSFLVDGDVVQATLDQAEPMTLKFVNGGDESTSFGPPMRFVKQ